MSEQTKLRLALAVGLAGAFGVTACAVVWRMLYAPWIGGR